MISSVNSSNSPLDIPKSSSKASNKYNASLFHLLYEVNPTSSSLVACFFKDPDITNVEPISLLNYSLFTI